MTDKPTPATLANAANAAVGTLQRILGAYGSQRDHIGDSDLDDEQPIALTVYLHLADIRWARKFVQAHGKYPADFNVRGPR
jgi:hypothetical protein